LISIIVRRPADRQHQQRRDLVGDQIVHGSVAHRQGRERIRLLDLYAQTRREHVGETRYARAAAGRVRRTDRRAGAGVRGEECDGALQSSRDLFTARLQNRVDMRRPVEAAQQRFGVVCAESALALKIFLESPRSEREVPRQNRDTFLENVQVGDVMPDVDERDHARHRVRMIELEGVVQREGIDVHDRGLEPRIAEHANFRIDQLALRGDEQHVHLQPVPIGVEDLEIELHRFHVEWDVLLRLPPHELTRLRFFHALDLNLLDDHVATADGGNDVLRRDACGVERALNCFSDHARVHDLTLDDRVLHQRLDRDLRELRFPFGMVDDRDLDQAGADVEANGGALTAEESHVGEFR
jgi:hypothetical protein